MIFTQSEVICPKCNHKMPRYTGNRAQYFVCSACKTYFSEFNFRLSIKGDFVREAGGCIPKGSIAIFDDIEYKVIGLLLAKETGVVYGWNEYVLYNNIYGYVTLSESNGQWNIIKPIGAPQKKGEEVNYEGLKYQLFNKYNTYYAGADGEFMWDLMPEKDNYIVEYIAPPYSLIRETNTDKTEWYQATYLKTSEVQKAFRNIKITFPRATGVISNQPNPYKNNEKSAWTYLVVFYVSMVFLYLLHAALVPNKEIFRKTLPIDTVSVATGTFKSYVSEDFKVNGPLGFSAVRLTLDAPMAENTWLETEVNLINQDTDDEFSTEIGIEYYHGYEGGENWSEGTHTEDKILSLVPNGTYKLSITPHAELSNGLAWEVHQKLYYYNFIIEENTKVISNYVIVLILALLYPMYITIRSGNFEKSRWIGSKYGS